MLFLLRAEVQVMWLLLSSMVPGYGAGAIYPLIYRNVKLLSSYRAGSKMLMTHACCRHLLFLLGCFLTLLQLWRRELWGCRSSQLLFGPSGWMLSWQKSWIPRKLGIWVSLPSPCSLTPSCPSLAAGLLSPARGEAVPFHIMARTRRPLPRHGAAGLHPQGEGIHTA